MSSLNPVLLPALALFGPTGAGKTTISNYLVANYGYWRCSSGDICRKITRLLFDSESKTVLNRLSDAINSIDDLALVRTALKSCPTHGIPVLDSIRRIEEYDYCKSAGFTLVSVTCPLALRVHRLANRGQEFVPEDDGAHVTERALESRPFDGVLVNDTDHAHLYQAIDALMSIISINRKLPS